MANNVFSLLTQKMGWLSERNKVVTSNLVNKGTPGYKAKDIKPLDFKKQVTQKAPTSNLTKTNAKHLSGTPSTSSVANNNLIKVGGESTLSGNDVDAEKEMMKATEISTQYFEMSSAYNKYRELFNMALGKSRR